MNWMKPWCCAEKAKKSGRRGLGIGESKSGFWIFMRPFQLFNFYFVYLML